MQHKSSLINISMGALSKEGDSVYVVVVVHIMLLPLLLPPLKHYGHFFLSGSGRCSRRMHHPRLNFPASRPMHS